MRFFAVSITLSTYASFLAASILIMLVLDGIRAWAPPVVLRLLGDQYLSDICFFRYGYLGSFDAWMTPDSGYELPAIAASVFAGWSLARVMPHNAGALGVGWRGTDRRSISTAWTRSRRLRHRWRARFGLLLGLFIGGLGAFTGALIDKAVYDARERAYLSQWSKMTSLEEPWPELPRPARRLIGWLTPADASIVLPGVFLATAASVLLPTRRVLRGSMFVVEPRCARCGYRLDPRPDTETTTCPECGHANPTLNPPAPPANLTPECS
jgi:hypothetical protein